MFGSKARKLLQIVRLGILPMECTDWGRWAKNPYMYKSEEIQRFDTAPYYCQHVR